MSQTTKIKYDVTFLDKDVKRTTMSNFGVDETASRMYGRESIGGAIDPEATPRVNLHRALEKAFYKHPHFIDLIHSEAFLMDVDSALEDIRKINDETNEGSFETVILEEFLEIAQAIKAGDYKRAYEESLDLAAVTLRASEYLRRASGNAARDEERFEVGVSKTGPAEESHDAN